MMTKGLVKMSLETKTEFMGAKALVASSDKKLNVQEYVDSSGFKIDKLMFNEFWQVVAKKQGAHVGTLLLRWLGYEGRETDAKRKFTDYLKRQNIPFENCHRQIHSIVSFNYERNEGYRSKQYRTSQVFGDELARFQESDHEVVYKERKRYSRVLSQRRGIASRVRGIRQTLRNTKT